MYVYFLNENKNATLISNKDEEGKRQEKERENEKNKNHNTLNHPLNPKPMIKTEIKFKEKLVHKNWTEFNFAFFFETLKLWVGSQPVSWNLT